MADGRISFKSDEPAMSFTCWLGTDGAKATGGYGGWDIVERPRRLSLTQWNGRNPISLDLSLIFDGWADNISQERSCQVLEKMAFSDDFNAPPLITIKGDTVPHSDQVYVITNIQWGDMIRRQSDGDRLRQEATVSVTRYVAADKVQLHAAKRLRLKTKREKKKAKKK